MRINAEKNRKRKQKLIKERKQMKEKYMKENTKLIRIDIELYNKIKKISKENEYTMVGLLRELIENIEYESNIKNDEKYI